MTANSRAAAVLAALQLGAACNCSAAEKGLFFGAGAGISKFDADANFNIDVTANGTPVVFTERDLDDDDTALEGSIGYRFSRHFAFEAQYLDLGRLAFTARGAAPASSSGVVTLRLESGVKGYAASGLGILPLNDRWELFGRVGRLFSDSTTTAQLFSASVEGSESSEAIMLGVGAALDLRKRLTLRVEYRAVEDDLKTVTLGLSFWPTKVR